VTIVAYYSALLELSFEIIPREGKEPNVPTKTLVLLGRVLVIESQLLWREVACPVATNSFTPIEELNSVYPSPLVPHRAGSATDGLVNSAPIRPTLLDHRAR
jgi:hypothetical protein